MPGDTLVRLRQHCKVQVSIHSRLLCREIHVTDSALSYPKWFQSTPGFYAGRYVYHSATRKFTQRFNPLPAFMPGDTGGTVGLCLGNGVSIHSRLLCREIRRKHGTGLGQELFQSTPGFYAGRYFAVVSGKLVSLGFNPLPAFMPGDTKFTSRFAPSGLFQSTPGFYAGRYGREYAHHECRVCFNPLPAFMPGDTRNTLSTASEPIVSIHSRLLCREIPLMAAMPTRYYLFQSTPGFYAGRYKRNRLFLTTAKCFNPLPAFMPGDTIADCRFHVSRWGFNPLPAFMPGDTDSSRVGSWRL